MLNLQTPQAPAVRVANISVNMVGADGPSISYSVEFGAVVNGVFVVAYSTNGLISGANAAAFVQQFANIEPQFLQFLASIGSIPALQVEVIEGAELK
jgi:hypothetical protein